MNFEIPIEDGFTIYTKPNCIFCDKVKQLLKNENCKWIDCESYLGNDREPFLEFIQNLIKKEHKTFPMVFKDSIFIGGFTETKVFYEKNSISWENMGFS